jgi:hypothetical protein
MQSINLAIVAFGQYSGFSFFELPILRGTTT